MRVLPPALGRLLVCFVRMMEGRGDPGEEANVRVLCHCPAIAGRQVQHETEGGSIGKNMIHPSKECSGLLSFHDKRRPQIRQMGCLFQIVHFRPGNSLPRQDFANTIGGATGNPGNACLGMPKCYASDAGIDGGSDAVY